MDEQVSSPLLSLNNNITPPFSSSSPPSRSSLFFTKFLSILLLICLACAVTFFFIYGNNAAANVPSSLASARPTKLRKPVVILISFDGFRYGYQFKTQTPNIHRLIKTGTEADLGLIPVFPTLTFPNHYAIVTGLYPSSHGIINNYFVEPGTGDVFKKSNDAKWWLGEPLWETAVNHGLRASTFFWPGSEVHKGKWDCPPDFCHKFNNSVPFEERVDTVLSYFDLPPNEIPSFNTIYFQDPDSQGHDFGPDDPKITEAIARADQMIGRLISGLEKRGIFDDVHVIMVGDHGMVGTCSKKAIFLSDLHKFIDIPAEWVQTYYPVFGVSPPQNVSVKETVEKIKQGLESGEVNNGEHLKVYLKEDLPSRLHYSDNYRIPPIIGILDEGYMLAQEEEAGVCGGAHGYDNLVFSMRTVFIGHGPRFRKGTKVASFENVEIYNLVTDILGIEGAANNGTKSFPKRVLLPGHH